MSHIFVDLSYKRDKNRRIVMKYKRLLPLVLAVIMAVVFCATPAMAAGGLVKNAGNPVVQPDDWETSVGACCVIVDGGEYVMWYSGIDSVTGFPAIGYATSSDGINWVKEPAPVFSGVDAWEDKGVGAPTVILDGSTYKMWYTGLSGTAPNFVPAIGYATSPDGKNWTAWGSNPVLEGTATEWDEYGVSLPSVIKDGATYKMWYTGHAVLTPGQIGYATSTTGYGWTKSPSNPVLSGDSSTWDGGGVFAASVKKTGSYSYVMFYTGYAEGGGVYPQIGRADSANGTSWIKEIDNPVLVEGGSGSWDERGVAAPTFLINDADTLLWYTGAEEMEGIHFQIGFASDEISRVPGSSSTSTAVLISGLAIAMAGVSIWSIKRSRA